MREYKSLPSFVKSIEDRTVVGIFSVHGIVDDGHDRSHPGAFADTKIQGRDRTVFLWMHNSSDPPIASINYVRDVPRAELPDSVLSFAPDATGGGEVSRTYLNTPRGNEVLEGIKAGAITEMSYAYDIASYTITEDEETGNQVRELYKLRLWDCSDVAWGMMPFTAASKGLDWKAQPLTMHAGAVEVAIRELADRMADLKAQREKQGRVFSSANYTALEGVADDLSQLEKNMRELLSRAEPKQKDDIRQLWLQTQRTLATLNGVT